MLNYDVLYASQQRFADLIAEANARPVERAISRPSVIGRAMAALKTVFAKPQAKQAPAMRQGLAAH